MKIEQRGVYRTKSVQLNKTTSTSTSTSSQVQTVKVN